MRVSLFSTQDPALHARFPDLVDEFKATIGGRQHTEIFICAIVRVVLNAPTLREHLLWVLDSKTMAPRPLHFIFARCPDGHPFIKARKDGATSDPMELVNLDGASQSRAFLNFFYVVLASETSPVAVALSVLLDEELSELHARGDAGDLLVHADLPFGLWGIGRGDADYAFTFEVLEKDDTKQKLNNQGTMGSCSRYPLFWHQFTTPRGEYPDTSVLDMQAACKSVSWEERKAQYEDADAARTLLAASGLAPSTVKSKFSNYVASLMHSMTSSPLFWSQFGQHDGNVHLPANTVANVLEGAFVLAQDLDASLKLEAASTGDSNTAHFISALRQNLTRCAADAFSARFNPEAQHYETKFRLGGKERNGVWRARANVR